MRYWELALYAGFCTRLRNGVGAGRLRTNVVRFFFFPSSRRRNRNSASATSSFVLLFCDDEFDWKEKLGVGVPVKLSAFIWRGAFCLLCGGLGWLMVAFLGLWTSPGLVKPISSGPSSSSSSVVSPSSSSSWPSSGSGESSLGNSSFRKSGGLKSFCFFTGAGGGRSGVAFRLH